MFNLKSSGNELLLVVLAIGALALGIGLVVFSQPLTKDVSAPLAYEQDGEFGYLAIDRFGVFDGGVIRTGQPVFRKLTQALTVTFQYTLTGEQIQAINGTFHIDAVVNDGSGWQRRLELQPVTPFNGTTFTTAVPLELTAVQGLIDRLETPTGLKRASYGVVIEAYVQVAGMLGNATLSDSFTPSLPFKLDKDMLSLAAQGQNSGGSGDSSKSNPLLPTQKGSINHTVSQPATITLLGLTVPVQTVRMAAVAGFVLALIGGILIFALGRKRRNPALDIQERFAELLVTVSNLEYSKETLIEVENIDDLVKLAEKESRMILHLSAKDGHYYFVQDGVITYRFSIAPAGLPPSP